MSTIQPIGTGAAGQASRLNLGQTQPAMQTDLSNAASIGQGGALGGASGLKDVNGLVGEFLRNLGLEENRNLKLMLAFLVMLALLEGSQEQSGQDKSGEQALAGLGRLAVAVGLASSASSGTAFDSQQGSSLTVVSQRIEWTSISATWTGSSFDSFA